VRLASPLPRTWEDPDGWVAAHRAAGFRAAHWPLDDDAGDDEVDAYADAARAADLLVAEIGAWSNPISPDDATRDASVELCKRRLALAERVGAPCCVTAAGSRGDTRDGPHPDNLSPATFALVVDTVRENLDAVQPRRAAFTLESMPWTIPDSPDAYLELLAAIDRPQAAVHLDPVNLINTPAKFYDHARFLRECFAKLGPLARSVHLKDLALRNAFTVHLEEVRPGLGELDLGLLLTEIERLHPDTPVLVEHLDTDEEYRAAVAHVRSVADGLG